MEARRVANGVAFGQFQLDTAERLDAAADGISQVPPSQGFSRQRRTQYVTRLVFHGATMTGCLPAQPHFKLLVDILNGHGHHVGLLVTVMRVLACHIYSKQQGH